MLPSFMLNVSVNCPIFRFILRMALSSYGSVDGDLSDLESARVDNNPTDTPDRHSLVGSISLD